MVKDLHIRSFVKGVSWRLFGTLDTILLSFIVTGNMSHSVRIGLTEVVTKIILYYFHERIWNSIRLGKKANNNASHPRSFLKGVTWRVVGTVDTIVISYLITEKPLSAFTIGGIEVFTKIILFYFHERVWNIIKWGRGSVPQGDEEVLYVKPRQVEQ